MPAIAIPAAISAGGSIFGGIMQGRSAKKAAQTQYDAALKAGGIVQDAVNQYSPQLVDAASMMGDQVMNAGEFAAGQAENAAVQGNATLADLYKQFSGAISPYQQQGQQGLNSLASLLQTGPGEVNLEQDPGYQFRLQEGMKALERSAAARGGSQGGAAAKSLARFSQGLASQEYQNAFNRSRSDYTTQIAGLSSLANFGQVANQQNLYANTAYGQGVSNNLFRGAEYAGNARMGTTQWAGQAYLNGVGQNVNNNINAAQSRAEYLTGGANARAAGQIAGGNATANMITNLANIGGWAAGKYFGNRAPGTNLSNLPMTRGDRNLEIAMMQFPKVG
jgi:hypothetical protein